jgi:hypothetical protein
MVSLTDIAPAHAKVMVQGKEVDVRGISAKMIAALLGRFPEMKLVMAGRSVETANLFQLAPTAIAAIIAAGTGNAGDEKVETLIEDFPIEDQANLLEAIGRLTFPSGIGPFVERIMALSAAVEGASGKAPALNSPKPSST